MLSSLASYLLGGSPSSQEARGESQGAGEESRGEHLPVETRLSQVEVEGDDWILIDRAVEGATALEESWYVTPPACFTRAGPVHVETSPLEDLLIEHPSMSVYRAAAPSVAPETPPPTPDAPAEYEACTTPTPDTAPSPAPQSAERGNLRRRHDREDEIQETPRRNAVHDHRPARDEEVRVVQLRTAQKVSEKRAAQALKRGRLERGNKVREVASGTGKRPRRQDRLRQRNSGANNNRKC